MGIRPWISGATLGEWAERAWRKLDCRSTVDRAQIYAHGRAVSCAAAFFLVKHQLALNP